MYILGGFLAAWGSSLIVRTRATRRVRRGQCAQCKRHWQNDEHTCPRCGSDKSRQAATTIPRPTTWTLVGLAVVLAGLTCPFWSLPLLGWLTGSSRVLHADLGLVGAIGLTTGSFALMTLVAAFLGDPARGRHRCRKCWYPMQPAVPAACPECGKTAAKPADLERTRRPLRPILAGLALLVIAQLGWFDPYIRQHGLVSLIPTDVLIANHRLVPSDWLLSPSSIGTNRWATQDYSLAGRLDRQRLTAAQIQRARVMAISRVAPSRTIDALRASLALVETAAAAQPAGTPGAATLPSGWPVNGFPRGGTYMSRGPSTPEADTAYADAVGVILRALESEPLQRQAAAQWLAEELGHLPSATPGDRTLGPKFLEAASARAADLRRIAASPDESAASSALLLLAISGTSGPPDVPRLATLLKSSDANVALLAQTAMGALAVSHTEASDAWRAYAGRANVDDPSDPARMRALVRSIVNNRSASNYGAAHLDFGTAYTTGALWRAALGPPECFIGLLTLDDHGAVSLQSHLALRTLVAHSPANADALVDYIIRHPDDLGAIEIFDSLGSARLRHLDRYITILDARNHERLLHSITEVLYAAMLSDVETIRPHRAVIEVYERQVHDLYVSGHGVRFDRYNLFARSQEVREWIDRPSNDRLFPPRP